MSRVVLTTGKICRRLRWGFESLTWPIMAPYYRARFAKCSPLDVSIGVTTYMNRFDSCLRPLLPKLFSLFPNEQVIVIANGHYLAGEQKEYISRFTDFCARFPGTEAEAYTDPRGLSSLWNRIIERSISDNILILNDDVVIKAGFRHFVDELLKDHAPVSTINGSWSHFLIRKATIEKVGLFDEGFSEVGGEDDDYLARMAMAELRSELLTTGTISGRSKRRMRGSGLNSYGKDMSKETGGYSTLNTEYLLRKWETADEYFEGAVEVRGRKTRYWKLREPASE